MALGEPQRRMKMSPRWRTVCAAASATEAVLLWCSQSPHMSMAGTLRSTTNCSLRKLRRARVGDFRFREASDAARWKGVARRKFSIPAVVVGTYIRRVLPHVCCGLRPRGRAVKKKRFGTFTHDLLQLADWLQECGVTHVAMESTGVYWKPVWNILAV